MGITITIVGGILAALVTTGSLAQRFFGISVAAALLVVPLTITEPPPLLYVTLAIAAIVALRVTDLSVERRVSDPAGLKEGLTRLKTALLSVDRHTCADCRAARRGL